MYEQEQYDDEVRIQAEERLIYLTKNKNFIIQIVHRDQVGTSGNTVNASIFIWFDDRGEAFDITKTVAEYCGLKYKKYCLGTRDIVTINYDPWMCIIDKMAHLSGKTYVPNQYL